MTYSDSNTPDGSTTSTVSTGTITWLWYDSDKNKTVIEMSGISSVSSLLTNGDIYIVDKLSSKELVLKISGTETSTTGLTTNTTTDDITYTFEKQ